jgi:hypothetical protein
VAAITGPADTGNVRGRAAEIQSLSIFIF